jgi:Glyoxalase-like domain
MTLPAHVADIHLRTTPAQLWAALTRPELTRRWYFRLAAESGLNSGPATATLLGALPIALGNLRSLLEIGRLLPIQTVTFDCAEPARLAAFWQEVTGYVPLDPGDGGAALIEPHGLGPRLKFNKVPEPKTVKNWVHLDIIVEDMMVAVERLVALGGRVLWTLDGSTVLADPEGNEFCIFS